jgi:hypothetical protein
LGVKLKPLLWLDSRNRKPETGIHNVETNFSDGITRAHDRTVLGGMAGRLGYSSAPRRAAA